MSIQLISLQITALGMGIVFAAIMLLSLMMSLLTRFIKDGDASASVNAPSSPTGMTPDLPGPVSVTGKDHKALAAAIAVAMVLSEQKLAQSCLEPPTALVSAWQLGMRTRQMYEKGSR